VQDNEPEMDTYGQQASLWHKVSSSLGRKKLSRENQVDMEQPWKPPSTPVSITWVQTGNTWW